MDYLREKGDKLRRMESASVECMGRSKWRHLCCGHHLGRVPRNWRQNRSDYIIKGLAYALKSIMRWMCCASVRDCTTNDKVRRRPVECISEVFRTHGLCWYGHVKRKDGNGQVKFVKILFS